MSLFVGGIHSGVALADSLCPTPEFEYLPGTTDFIDPTAPVEALADRVVSQDGVFELRGQTQLSFQNRRIYAENAIYDSAAGTVEINGDLVFESEGVRLKSSDARINLHEDSFTMGDSRYETLIGSRSATGAAESISRTEDGLFRLDKATYSTCPPGDQSWYIRADSIILDTREGIGTANRIHLNFKGVPLLAVPTFSFPISPKRKTGFLAPILSSNDRTGIELQVPWYWNAAPNFDATFTPRFMSKRGVQLQGEFRYLNELGHWTFDSEYLYDDQMPTKQRDRRFNRLQHTGRFLQNWHTSLDINSVSDKFYFDDLGDSLSIASITHLQRQAEVAYRTERLTFISRLQSYQTVDPDLLPEERPYRRLPQFLVHAKSPLLPYGARASLDAELVHFDRERSVTGTRLDLHPTLSLPYNREAWFVEPRVGFRLSNYRLGDVPSDVDRSITRFLPAASLDAGLFFDRKLDDKGSVQTFEPRLFLLRVPYEDQSDIPTFDSYELDFNISQLFRENRFSGADRIADANQLSTAFTTRFIDGPTGQEQLRAGIGQIFYFDDRRVWLEEDRVESGSSSDLVAEAAAEVGNWLFRTNMQLGTNDSESVRNSVLVSYRPDATRLLNIAYRNIDAANDELTEQLDVSFKWPFRHSWRLAGRWNYSLDSDSSIDTLLGVEYESCCWAFRFAGRRYIADNGQDHETSYYFQLVLKGLAPLGDNIGELLSSSVFGYQDKYQ